MSNFYIDPESGGIIPLPEEDLDAEDVDAEDEIGETYETYETGEDIESSPEEDQVLYPAAPTGLFLVDSTNVAGRYNLQIGFQEVPTAVEYEVRVTKA